MTICQKPAIKITQSLQKIKLKKQFKRIAYSLLTIGQTGVTGQTVRDGPSDPSKGLTDGGFPPIGQTGVTGQTVRVEPSDPSKGLTDGGSSHRSDRSDRSDCSG